MFAKSLATLAGLLVAATTFAAGAGNPALIPWPQIVQPWDGKFTLTSQTRIYCDWSSRKTAQFLAQRLHTSTGYPLKVHWKPFGTIAKNENVILLATKSANTNLGPEGYLLLVNTNSIVVSAPTQAGLFYGSQTLLQLLPPEIFSTNEVAGVLWQAPCVQIADWPRFPWRGLMLDVSRHFFNKAEVETILDDMALYKLNRFHWHLVDDQGWRIEIKKYPKLTQIGAWREHCDIEPPDPHLPAPAWAKPTPDKFGPNGRYGGFYTQKDIREIVAYATARHITVVPEIEMPGHSEAALAAYPQFSCFGGPYATDSDLSIHDGICDPSNGQTFQFLDDVLAEVFQLFPGPCLHIGGDEVRKDYWDKSPACRALMQRQGLRSEDELQSYFIKRMEKFINSRGKTLVGWSEILKGSLATNAVVMDWIGGGKQAAEAGHDAVMTPIDYCYLDHFHSPKAVDNYALLQKVYAFEPIPAGLPPPLPSHILGAEAVLWTEYIASLPHVQYMLFPRACALSEVVWSARGARDWNGFQQRLKTDELRLAEQGVHYRPDDAPPIVEFPPVPSSN